jgi:hypothetical protein
MPVKRKIDLEYKGDPEELVYEVRVEITIDAWTKTAGSFS